MPDKYCSRCNNWLDPSEFGSNKSNKDGLQHWCKLCKNGYQRKHRKYNPEKEKEYQDRFYQRHPEKAKAQKERWKAHGKEWNRSHLDHRNDYLSQHRKENPEMYQQYRQNYRANKNNVPGEFTAEQFERVKEIFDYCCASCGQHESECGTLAADHVIPLTPRDGQIQGTNSIENIQPLCRSCNSSKTNTHQDFRKRGFFKQLFPQIKLF